MRSLQLSAAGLHSEIELQKRKQSGCFSQLCLTPEFTSSLGCRGLGKPERGSRLYNRICACRTLLLQCKQMLSQIISDVKSPRLYLRSLVLKHCFNSNLYATLSCLLFFFLFTRKYPFSFNKDMTKSYFFQQRILEKYLCFFFFHPHIIFCSYKKNTFLECFSSGLSKTITQAFDLICWLFLPGYSPFMNLWCGQRLT